MLILANNGYLRYRTYCCILDLVETYTSRYRYLPRYLPNLLTCEAIGRYGSHLAQAPSFIFEDFRGEKTIHLRKQALKISLKLFLHEILLGYFCNHAMFKKAKRRFLGPSASSKREIISVQVPI